MFRAVFTYFSLEKSAQNKYRLSRALAFFLNEKVYESTGQYYWIPTLSAFFSHQTHPCKIPTTFQMDNFDRFWHEDKK